MFYDFPKDFKELEPVPGVLTRLVWGQNLMLSHDTLPPNYDYPFHGHPEEQMGIVLEGKSVITLGDETKLLKKGDMYHVPSNLSHKIVTHTQGAVFLNIFSPPRETYINLIQEGNSK